MTTPSTPRKAGPLLGTGAQTTWPFTFKVFAASDIAVTIANNLGVETALVLNTDYSVTLNSNQETSPGGTVTYPISGSALPVGKRLVIVGNLPYDQPLDLPSGGNFSPLALENQLDRLTMQIQQLRENLSRALQLPVTAEGTLNVALPTPSANQLIGWDAGGNDLQNVALSSIATALAFATYRFDTFTGDGTETQFTLSADPATLGNLDIAMGGVTQTPGTDYTLSSGVLVFNVAPPLGVTILARYGEGLPPGAVANANDVSYSPLVGSQTTVEVKLREYDFFVGHGGSGEATNTRLGEDALASNTTGTNNTAVGKKAMELNTTGYQNTAVGVDAMFQNSTGHYNTSVGEGSMMENTTGTNNTAIGHSSYKFSTTGSFNTALGKAALHNGGSGSNNTAGGYASMFYATTGSRNTVFGNQAGQYTSSGNNNTFFGYNAGLANTSSSYNTFYGSNAGESIDTGTKNTIVGAFNGNQNGLDIRNANKHAVIADGDGVPKAWWNQDGLFRTPAGVCFGSLQALTASGTINENAYYVLVYAAAGTVTLTLAPRVGRVLKILNQSSQLVQSASSNIATLVNGALGTQIIPGTAGKWVELWCDGTNWNIIAAN